MKKAITVFIFLFTTLVVVDAQTIYSKAFGNPKHKPLIFLHGGPGYNSVNFEATTAEKLSGNGFYVIVYDRRGEGRSVDKNVNFTFNEAFNDLHSIFDTYKLKSATLIGHSFGGIIGTLFTEKFPSKVKSLVLVGAPISMQEVFSTILKSSKKIYQSKNDVTNLNYIKILEKMDKSSLRYSSYCFSHAMQNGFYSPKEPTKEALQVYAEFRTNPLLKKYSMQMTYEAPRGFWKNESYTSLNLNKNLKQVLKNGTPIFGLYGKDDGLFSEIQITNIKQIINQKRFKYLGYCSHNVFIDQQSKFIEVLKKWIN